MGRRVKRAQVQAGDGWTVVTTQGASSSKGSGSTDEAARGAKPERVVEGLTVERLVGDLKGREERFRGTQVAAQIERTLDAGKGKVIESAVCIGIGSFSLDWEHRHRAMWQLVLFRGVVAKLKEINPESQIALYAQEPIFTSLDIEFLATLGITVVGSDIETHITPATFVFAPFVDWHILLPVFLRAKNPELYIGNEILGDYSMFAKSEEKEKVLKESNELGESFLEGRESLKIEDFALHPHALNGLVFYSRTKDDQA
ncbi:hypothetical protein BS50DRAFT_597564 [Corynespora cassiicola Philippines]|uniref:SRR1-like domain-containing protein n=1 Tax=Corynespora cassiicola Philippines TaxID=1448308 RepID=A0A2T2P3B0_CORCC|nr:hypothetical protein BS50DRAFT_597564 [Corynespora cassiicola Philippines]